MPSNQSTWDIFLAYATPDADLAEALYALLEPHARVFLDRARLVPGDEWDRTVATAQEQSRITVALVSENTPEAWYQRHEIITAIARTRDPASGHRLVPVYLSENLATAPFAHYGLGPVQGLRVSDDASLRTAARRILALLNEQLARIASQRHVRRARCMLWGRWDGANPPVFQASQRVAKRFGFEVRVRETSDPAQSLAWRGLLRDAQSSLVAVVVDDNVPQAVWQAIRGRPVIVVRDRQIAAGSVPPHPEVIPVPVDDLATATAEHLENLICQGFDEAIGAIVAWVNEVNRATAQTGIRLPPDLFDLPVATMPADRPGGQLAGVESRFTQIEHQLFPTLAGLATTGHRTAVTGLPGSGKSILITRYCDWLRRQHGQAERAAWPSSVPPVAVVLRAHDFDRLAASTEGDRDTRPLGSRLWESLRDRVAAASVVAAYTVGEGELDLVQAMRASGRFQLIIDGFDEFASRNRALMYDVLDAVQEMAREGAVVVLACRANFWDEQVRDRGPMDTRVRILELGLDEARRLLVDVPLPPAARSVANGEIAHWLRSPLLIRFLRLLHARGDRATLYDAVQNRTAVYRQWARWVADEAQRLGLHGDFIAVCEDVALQFVEQRRFHLDAGVVLDRINRTQMRLDRPTTLAQLDALEVFERATERDEIFNPAVAASIPGTDLEALKQQVTHGGLRFHHETILEYFATARLCQDFLAVLADSDGSADLSELQLSRLTLDYFQSSVYGFLDELLEPHGYRQRLVRHLSSVDLTQLPQHLLRNLIEYLGLTARSDTDRELARLLAGMVADDQLPLLIRYNSARALERAHPLGPRPYFEWVSDWGATDFGGFKKRQITAENDGPWVIRGWKALAPACRRYLSFAPNREVDDHGGELQREISGLLLDTLEKLIEDGRSEDAATRVNVSLCLVRWFDEAHLARWRSVCRAANRPGIERETRENLEQWVMRQWE